MLNRHTPLNTPNTPNTDFVKRFGRLGVALATTAVAVSMFAAPSEAGDIQGGVTHINNISAGSL